MTNLMKEAYFLTLVKQSQSPPDFSDCGNQSIHITLDCGCRQTQHPLCGKPKVDENHPNFHELQSVRFAWHEFCPTHDKSSWVKPVPTKGYIIDGLENAYRATALPLMKRSSIGIVENQDGNYYTIHEIEQAIIKP